MIGVLYWYDELESVVPSPPPAASSTRSLRSSWKTPSMKNAPRFSNAGNPASAACASAAHEIRSFNSPSVFEPRHRNSSSTIAGLAGLCTATETNTSVSCNTRELSFLELEFPDALEGPGFLFAPATRALPSTTGLFLSAPPVSSTTTANTSSAFLYRRRCFRLAKPWLATKSLSRKHRSGASVSVSAASEAASSAASSVCDTSESGW
mmetsp:Transcript_2316/g.8065  ORF Transcript_2316/g.8065 Transcript_2316/m.8065 type:complete len:208 (-) Transcript_2316:588-1211(-)